MFFLEILGKMIAMRQIFIARSDLDLLVSLEVFIYVILRIEVLNVVT